MIKIDNRKKYFLVFDTETTTLDKEDAFGKPLIYDIGFAVCDKKGKIYESYNYIVRNIYYSNAMNNAFYGNKRPWYDEQIEKGNILVRDFGQVLYNLNKVMSRYPNITLSAYNLSFDLRALKATADLTNQKRYKGNIESLFDRDFEIQDIWAMAVESIYLPQKGYKRFIDLNGLYTDKGNPKSSAEVGYRYMHNDKDFIEDHTALSDVFIEVEILAHALRQHKKYSKGIFHNPWRLLSEYKKAM